MDAGPCPHKQEWYVDVKTKRIMRKPCATCLLAIAAARASEGAKPVLTEEQESPSGPRTAVA